MPSNNNRVYYAVHAVGFAPHGGSGFLAASGVQSVGMDTTFNLEQVFQLGQLDLYENIENIPNVEATIEKVLDGAALLQHLATQDATASTLAGRYNDNRAMFALAYFDDANSSASGTALAEVILSGVYVDTMTFNLPVDGNFSESITLVGNDKVWGSGAAVGTGDFGFIPNFDNDDVPPAADGVQRRENMIMSGCLWPLELPGISSSGSNDLISGKHQLHMQSVNVSISLGRTELFELGRRGPYHRFAEFPAEVTCAIEVIETEFGDLINAREEVENLTNQTIYILTSDGTRINLGTKNKLASISSTGGETGGGNRSTTYNYSNFNFFTVTHDLDPVISLRP